MNEKRSVDCGGEVIEYMLARKKVKNVNMRVKADGSVSVSAPSRVSAKLIDDFVRSRCDFIRSSVERLSAESGSIVESALAALPEPIFPISLRTSRCIP